MHSRVKALFDKSALIALMSPGLIAIAGGASSLFFSALLHGAADVIHSDSKPSDVVVPGQLVFVLQTLITSSDGLRWSSCAFARRLTPTSSTDVRDWREVPEQPDDAHEHSIEHTPVMDAFYEAARTPVLQAATVSGASFPIHLRAGVPVGHIQALPIGLEG